MKKLIKALMIVGASTVALTAAPAKAATYVEDFEAAFPAWESGWLGTQSNLSNYYGIPSERGNNPDGLWIGNLVTNFNPTFAATLTSLSVDVATWVNHTFTIFDKNGATLFTTSVTPNYGAYTDPGTYHRFSTTSTNGIGGFAFSGSNVLGNTGIDNVVASSASVSAPVVPAVPEPATWAMFLIGFGAVGYSMRSRKVGYKALQAV